MLPQLRAASYQTAENNSAFHQGKMFQSPTHAYGHQQPPPKSLVPAVNLTYEGKLVTDNAMKEVPSEWSSCQEDKEDGENLDDALTPAAVGANPPSATLETGIGRKFYLGEQCSKEEKVTEFIFTFYHSNELLLSVFY